MQISTLLAWRPAGLAAAPSSTAPLRETEWADWEWSARTWREASDTSTIISSSRDTALPVWAWRKLPWEGGGGEEGERGRTEMDRVRSFPDRMLYVNIR